MSTMYQASLLIPRSGNANLQLEFDLYYMYKIYKHSFCLHIVSYH